MTTLATLKAEIADDLARSDLTSQIASEITAAIKHYKSHRFWFTESRDVTFSTVANQPNYTLSEEVWRNDGVFIERGANPQIWRLTPLSYQEWEAWQDTTSSTGWPTRYVRHNDEMLLYPTPDQVDTVRITGVKSIAAPTSDAEVGNVWMTDGYELIRSRANRMICQKKIKAFEEAAVWANSELEELTDLRTKSAKILRTRKIKPTKF